jgi:branched-chain amino acid transport system permease protein
VVGAALWLFMRETRFGIIIRAGTFDSEMVGALGIDIRRVFTIMFGIGIFLAAVGGVLAGPMIGVYSTMGTDVIIDAFIIVVIGGLGSVRGSFVGALLIGFSRSFGAFYADQLVPIILFTLMIVVLLVRPHGLFGQQGIFEH